MEPRTIAFGLIAVIAAFAAAFGIASSGGGKTATAGPGTKAETIKVAAPAAVAGVEVGGTVPSLKSEAKKKVAKKKAAKNTASSPSTSSNSSPSTTNSTPAPSTQNTTPSTPSTPRPSTPKPSTPKPSTPKPNTTGPVGGEDG